MSIRKWEKTDKKGRTEDSMSCSHLFNSVHSDIIDIILAKSNQATEVVVKLLWPSIVCVGITTEGRGHSFKY